MREKQKKTLGLDSRKTMWVQNNDGLRFVERKVVGRFQGVFGDPATQSILLTLFFFLISEKNKSNNAKDKIMTSWERGGMDVHNTCEVVRSTPTLQTRKGDECYSFTFKNSRLFF